MFYDWLALYQDHNLELPILGDRHSIVIDTETGEKVATVQPAIQHEGSYSTKILVRVSGSRVYVSGNPSRLGRADNLFGIASIDACVAVYNRVLRELGLPEFTRATERWIKTDGPGSYVTNGATITEIHVTSNHSVGEGSVQQFIRAISTQPFRNMIPDLKANGCTCEWRNKQGDVSQLMLPSVYDKGHQIQLKQLSTFRRKFGDDSSEVKYLNKIIQFCRSQGIVRFELKLKAAFLRRNGLNHYGFENVELLRQIHREYIAITSKLEVENMTFETISEQLLNAGYCKTMRQANSTAQSAYLWMHGKDRQVSERTFKSHRAILRKIGIDIALPCDLTKFAVVKPISAGVIKMQPVSIPSWYQRPAAHLEIAA